MKTDAFGARSTFDTGDGSDGGSGGSVTELSRTPEIEEEESNHRSPVTVIFLLMLLLVVLTIIGVAATGNAGRLVASRIGAGFVNEVVSQSTATGVIICRSIRRGRPFALTIPAVTV